MYIEGCRHCMLRTIHFQGWHHCSLWSMCSKVSYMFLCSFMYAAKVAILNTFYTLYIPCRCDIFFSYGFSTVINVFFFFCISVLYAMRNKYYYTETKFMPRNFFLSRFIFTNGLKESKSVFSFSVKLFEDIYAIPSVLLQLSLGKGSKSEAKTD